MLTYYNEQFKNSRTFTVVKYRGDSGRIAYNKGMIIPEIRLQFTRRLKTLRKRFHLTQEQMAERLEMDVRYYQRLESNKPGAVKIDTIGRIAKALNLTPSKLLDFK